MSSNDISFHNEHRKTQLWREKRAEFHHAINLKQTSFDLASKCENYLGMQRIRRAYNN